MDSAKAMQRMMGVGHCCFLHSSLMERASRDADLSASSAASLGMFSRMSFSRKVEMDFCAESQSKTASFLQDKIEVRAIRTLKLINERIEIEV